MKRIAFIVLLCGIILLSFTAVAEGRTISGQGKSSLPVDENGKVILNFSADNVTGNRPSNTSEELFSLTMEDSAVPFAEIDWDSPVDEVIAITGGQLADNQTDIEQEIILPGISEPQIAVYHIGENGLNSVSVIVEGNIKKTTELKDSPQAQSLIEIVQSYYNTQDADEKMGYTWGPTYFYKSTVTDVALGYFPSGKKYDFGIVFYKASAFDNSLFRDDTLYVMSTDYDGTLYYAADASRLKRVTVSVGNADIDVCFSDAINMYGSSQSLLNALPYFRFVFIYIGRVNPEGANTFIFTLNKKLYQFTIPEDKITISNNGGTYISQYSFIIGKDNAEFMDAFVNAEGDVPFEMRRDERFRVSFSINKDWVKAAEEDWGNFKQAGGLSPFYGLASDETPLKVY